MGRVPWNVTSLVVGEKAAGGCARFRYCVCFCVVLCLCFCVVLCFCVLGDFVVCVYGCMWVWVYEDGYAGACEWVGGCLCVSMRAWLHVGACGCVCVCVRVCVHVGVVI